MITFDSPPPVQQWSTRTWPGSDTDLSDLAALNAAAMTNEAADITAPLASLAGNPPAGAGTAVYAADAGAHFIQTRPSGVAYAGVMATLTNASGTSPNVLGLSYTLTVAAAVPEQVYGLLVYYSMTGRPGSWTQIPDLSNQPEDARAKVLEPAD